MYEASSSAILLEGEKLAAFRVDQGVAQGCSLSPILFSVFINSLLKDVEETGLGIEISSGKRMGGMLFADDFVGVSESRESPQKLIEVNGRKEINQLHSVISNQDINLTAHRLLLLSVIRPSIEYGGEIWEGNKGQVAGLESIILGGAKRILGCSSKTCS